MLRRIDESLKNIDKKLRNIDDRLYNIEQYFLEVVSRRVKTEKKMQTGRVEDFMKFFIDRTNELIVEYSLKDLYKEYVSYCGDNNFKRHLGKKLFNKQLQRMGCVTLPRRANISTVNFEDIFFIGENGSKERAFDKYRSSQIKF